MTLEHHWGSTQSFTPIKATHHGSNGTHPTVARTVAQIRRKNITPPNGSTAVLALYLIAKRMELRHHHLLIQSLMEKLLTQPTKKERRVYNARFVCSTMKSNDREQRQRLRMIWKEPLVLSGAFKEALSGAETKTYWWTKKTTEEDDL